MLKRNIGNELIDKDEVLLCTPADINPVENDSKRELFAVTNSMCLDLDIRERLFANFAAPFAAAPSESLFRTRSITTHMINVVLNVFLRMLWIALSRTQSPVNETFAGRL